MTRYHPNPPDYKLQHLIDPVLAAKQNNNLLRQSQSGLYTLRDWISAAIKMLVTGARLSARWASFKMAGQLEDR